jgi:hypothetical protein
VFGLQNGGSYRILSIHASPFIQSTKRHGCNPHFLFAAASPGHCKVLPACCPMWGKSMEFLYLGPDAAGPQQPVSAMAS